MSLSNLTARARRRAESHMLDECEIRRPSVIGPLDPITGEYDITPGGLVYIGKCKVFTYEPFETVDPSGDYAYTVQRYRLHIPVDVEGIQVDDEAEITVAPLDSASVGRRFRIAGLLRLTMARDQRLMVDEITD